VVKKKRSSDSPLKRTLNCIGIETPLATQQKIKMASHYPQKVPEHLDDCRDFLRTGRCKYGASCKFSHPSNVQSGGGVRAPVDPSEPLFPVRPNEPVCQYYMKHGSCKFGQACKFHHPPQSSVAAATLVGSNTIFVPRQNEVGSLPQHILLNPVGADQGPSMMLQFLPQRPDEPDCLYFLRNGTCKYGATCRYHHPVNQQRKPNEVQQRRQPQQQVLQLPAHVANDGTVQFVQSQQTYPPQNTRVVSTSGGQHMLVTETPIQVRSMNNGGYQQVAVPMSNGDSDFAPSAGSQMSAGVGGMSQDHASSSSSIASSYDTSSSNLEYITQGQAGSWNRFKRSSSGGSLSAYGEPVRHQPMHTSNRVMVSQGGSDSSRRLRAASFGSMGSASDQSSYLDGVVGWSSSNGPHGSRPMHQERYAEGAHVFEQPRRQHRVDGYESRNEHSQQHRQPHDQAMRTIPRGQGPPRQSKSGNVDHGLSMMTSALLNMLDTPEDAAAKSYPSRISSSSTLNNCVSPPATPRSGNMQSPQYNSVPVLNERLMPQSTSSSSLFQPEVRHQVVYTTQNQYTLRGENTPSMYAPSKQHNPAYANVEHFQDTQHHWSPTYAGQPIDQRSQTQSVHMQHRTSNGPASPQSANVGLYL